MVDDIIEYSIKNLDLGSPHYRQSYLSLPVCIIDCVYSLRAKYFSTTVPVVERYARQYMQGNCFSNMVTISEFVNQITDVPGGAKGFARNILKNNQYTGQMLKAEVCYELARKLSLIGIETIENFRAYNQEILEIIVRSVKGIGDAGVNYLFMLAGDPNRCKPDVHIHQFIKDACGQYVSNEECQVLLSKTVKQLNNNYPHLTVAKLDGIIWNKYQAKNK